MAGNIKLFVFTVGRQQFAIHLSNLERIVRIVEIDPLPLAPEFIAGTINFHGEFLAVLNIRKLFLMPQRDIDLNDKLIITSTPRNRIALWVDSVNEIVERDDEAIFKTDKILLDVGYVEGLFRFNDGMVLLNDLDKFLTPVQFAKLTEALKKQKDKDKEKSKSKVFKPSTGKSETVVKAKGNR
jgi:purine-binding chemotaxis protein CheW